MTVPLSAEREAEFRALVETPVALWPIGPRRVVAETLAELERVRADNETLKDALGAFLRHPRYLSIGSLKNTVEVRVSAEAFAAALAAAGPPPTSEEAQTP